MKYFLEISAWIHSMFALLGWAGVLGRASDEESPDPGLGSRENGRLPRVAPRQARIQKKRGYVCT